MATILKENINIESNIFLISIPLLYKL